MTLRERFAAHQPRVLSANDVKTRVFQRDMLLTKLEKCMPGNEGIDMLSELAVHLNALSADLHHTLRMSVPFTFDQGRPFSEDELKLAASVQHAALVKLTTALGWTVPTTRKGNTP